MSDDLREQFDQHLEALFADEDEALQTVRTSTKQHDMPSISVRPYEGYLLNWLTHMAGARIAVEIGTLAGYSGTWIARALPEDGKLYTIEKSSKHADVARQNFDMAGVGERVEILQSDGMEALEQIAQHGPFGLVFIDADKEAYPDYLTWAVDNLHQGGIVTAHNAFRNGSILHPETESDYAVRRFHQMMADDIRLRAMIIPTGDGLSVAVRR